MNYFITFKPHMIIKKIISGVFLLLAIFFCTKDIMMFMVSAGESQICVMDLKEENSSDSSEKDDIDEKDDINIFHQDYTAALMSLQSHFEIIFHKHPEKNHALPYFEVFSPPPESVLS